MSITPRVIQRTPDLGIKIKLQRLPVVPVQTDAPAPAPAPAGACSVFGAGWLVNIENWNYDYFEPYNSDGWMFEGGELEYDAGGKLLNALGSEFRCTQLEIGTSPYERWAGHTFFAVMQGESMSGVRWEFEWDAPSDDDSSRSVLGHAVSVFGNVLQVKTQAPYGGDMSRETLTVRAFCGDELVSTLTFIAVAPGW